MSRLIFIILAEPHSLLSTRSLIFIKGLVRQLTKHRFYRAWVTIKPVGSAKSCRPKVNSGYKDATPANGSEERTGEMLRARRSCDGCVPQLKKG
ncbi:hypothetical protein PIB30_026877 [Stylosanthes scabra]|uniref:Secreted protein n=1 Tax=Stylosanthes scabra TaxID=79078 RepID=A0ABU6UAA6_9FABA|nr:hypothetical protein [Stylosanthes scabra]